MVIAIGIAAALAVYLSNRSASRTGRIDKLGLAVYAQKAQREETFPFDYLSR